MRMGLKRAPEGRGTLGAKTPLRTSKGTGAAAGMTPRRSDLKVSHYQHEETAKSGRVERGGECTYNRATPALLRGIPGTHEGKAMDE